MAQFTIEFAADQHTADVRVAVLETKGYTVAQPEAASKAIIRTSGIDPQIIESLTDPDGEIWVIIARK